MKEPKELLVTGTVSWVEYRDGTHVPQGPTGWSLTSTDSEAEAKASAKEIIAERYTKHQEVKVVVSDVEDYIAAAKRGGPRKS